jgi:hypothetical protein
MTALPLGFDHRLQAQVPTLCAASGESVSGWGHTIAPKVQENECKVW